MSHLYRKSQKKVTAGSISDNPKQVRGLWPGELPPFSGPAKMPSAREEQASLTVPGPPAAPPTGPGLGRYSVTTEAHVRLHRWGPSSPAAAVPVDVGSRTPARARGALAACTSADGQSWLAGEHAARAQKPPRTRLSRDLEGEWVTSPHGDLGRRGECSGKTFRL